jgi:hypothetical protein
MVVRTASDRVQAVVEFVTAEKDGDYGPYRSVLFKRCDLEGEAAKVWRSMKPEEAEVFSKGQTVYLVPTERKGKQTWDVELFPAAATPPPLPAPQSAPEHQPLSPTQKKAIAAYIGEQADLYAYCLEVAFSKIGPSTDGETVRCMATALYESTQRRFNI